MDDIKYIYCPRCGHKMYCVGLDEDYNIIYQCTNCENVEIRIIEATNINNNESIYE